MRDPQFLGALALQPQFGFRRSAHGAGTMATGVIQPDAVVSVGTCIDVVAMDGSAAGADIPRRPAASLVQSMGRIYGRKMIVKDLLNRP